MWWGKGANRCSWSCAGNCIITFTTRSVLHNKAAIQLYRSANNSTTLFVPYFCTITITIIIIIIAVACGMSLCHVCGHFQSESSAECDVLHPISISITSFCKVIQHQLTFSSSPSRHFCPSLYLSVRKVFQKAVPAQGMTNLFSLHSFYFNMIFLPSRTICNPSFLPPSDQVNFSILPQHRNSKLSLYF